MPALARLATDILDVRLGLAQAIADLFILGAFYGDKALPVPNMIQKIVNQLARDESSDVRDALREVGADRWASNDSSLSASEALSEASSANENPENLAHRVEEALSTESTEVAAHRATPHNRAQIPSPNIDDDDDMLSMSSSDDPFEASFARAQANASERNIKRSSVDEVLAVAHRATTLPDAMQGSPPVSSWDSSSSTPTSISNKVTPTFGLGIRLRDSPPPAAAAPP